MAELPHFNPVGTAVPGDALLELAGFLIGARAGKAIAGSHPLRGFA
jgi:hypothetical protein